MRRASVRPLADMLITTDLLFSFNNACSSDGSPSIHEIVSHLGNTHIVLEGPVVAMNRQLPNEHPIYDLLRPHLEGTALINWGAQNVRTALLGGGGGRVVVETMPRISSFGSWKITREADAAAAATFTRLTTHPTNPLSNHVST